MKFDKEMFKQLALIIVGVLAALFGYDVITDDGEVTISLPEQVEAADAEEADAEEADAEEADAEEADAEEADAEEADAEEADAEEGE